MTNYTFSFTCQDNGGKRQAFTVKAASKQAAIDKAFRRAEKAARGNITTWDCRLQPSF